MDLQLRNQIQRSLRTLVAIFGDVTRQFEETLRLLDTSADLDPRAYFDQYPFSDPEVIEKYGVRLERGYFTVAYRGHTCFLNNSNSFRLLATLLQKANRPVSHDELFEKVWQTERPCESALRSAIKVLRKKLRVAGLGALSDAIIGSIPGFYRLQLS